MDHLQYNKISTPPLIPTQIILIVIDDEDSYPNPRKN